MRHIALYFFSFFLDFTIFCLQRGESVTSHKKIWKLALIKTWKM